MGTKRLAVTAAFFFIFICCIVLLTVYKPKKKYSPPPRDYSIDEEPFLPPEPGLQDSYIYTNEISGAWTREESEKLFSIPEGKQLEQLENSNDILVKRILESAP